MTDAGAAAGSPLLTIAIPTYNRAGYLAMNLAQLRSQLPAVQPGSVEIIVSDNCSTDDTSAVVERAIHDGIDVRYVRNERNLGWALNFAQSFERSSGRYVLLLGDDDLLIDGALRLLMDRLERGDYGVVCLRPYGFDHDFRAEHPGGNGRETSFQDANAFLVAISRYFTLTSACVINKSLIRDVDSREFISTDLAAFHLVLRAALAGPANLYIERYLLASKRQNSSSYDYVQVFVEQLWQIVDAHQAHGLTRETIRRLERDKLLSYYPFYLFDLRLSGRSDRASMREPFERRFADRLLYRLWLAPTLRLPRPLALAWGAATTAVGRVIGGDLRRGVRFAWNRMARALRLTPNRA